jgi:hypothetical protein
MALRQPPGVELSGAGTVTVEGITILYSGDPTVTTRGTGTGTVVPE